MQPHYNTHREGKTCKSLEEELGDRITGMATR